MPFNISQLKRPVVLLGNGETPTHRVPTKLLNNAETVLCADGGANKLENFKLKPNIILGDLDSISNKSFDCEVIELKDQSKTDIEKCLNWCLENGINKISLIGFSGEQDDHWMVSLWTLVSFVESMELTYYSNFSKIICVKDYTQIDSIKDQTISIIPTKENIKITTIGLQYPINNSILKPPSFGIRNSAKGNCFSIQATGPVWVFLNYEN